MTNGRLKLQRDGGCDFPGALGDSGVEGRYPGGNSTRLATEIGEGRWRDGRCEMVIMVRVFRVLGLSDGRAGCIVSTKQ